MVTISLCMIVKNEQAVLSRCLSSVADIADEMIIVDTGSTDSTIEIAKSFTDHVFSFPWQDDFSAARNASLSHAKMDFCLWLDADDVLEEPDRQALIALKSTLSLDVDIVMMKYHTDFDKNGHPTFTYYRERLLQNGKGFEFVGAIHEVVIPKGNILYSPIAITHKKLHPSDPNRNIKIFESMIKKGHNFDPREQFYYSRELYYHKKYEQAIHWFSLFLDNPSGWIENKIDACRLLCFCYQAMGDKEQAFQSLLQSLKWDQPRAEICCEIGSYFLEKQQYSTAIFWFTTASQCTRHDQSGAFIIPDCYDYIPYLQLCVCYDRMGNLEEAEKWNTLAGKIKPTSPSFLKNKEYFAKQN